MQPSLVSEPSPFLPFQSATSLPGDLNPGDFAVKALFQCARSWKSSFNQLQIRRFLSADNWNFVAVPFERARDPKRGDFVQGFVAADGLQMAGQERIGLRIGHDAGFVSAPKARAEVRPASASAAKNFRVELIDFMEWEWVGCFSWD